MNTYERNLKRLKDAAKLLALADSSGTLVDRNIVNPLATTRDLVRASSVCLRFAIDNQEKYLASRRERE